MRGSPWAFILENARTAGFIGSTWKKGHVAAAQARISMLGLVSMSGWDCSVPSQDPRIVEERDHPGQLCGRKIR